ncbi:MFS transporter [Parashewanella tropica]|uniref:MFS transporter n=1 Tax=Parashewanella tropica TaxID=2547970 RepID=UPI001478A3BA|nr:MFS transporter [Parashewanella tropica]
MNNETTNSYLICAFIIGFITFSLLYVIQPLLPDLTTSFRLSSSQSTLALSTSLIGIVLALLLSGMLLSKFRFIWLCVLSLLAASLCNLWISTQTQWCWVLTLRFFMGLFVGIVPASFIAYLSSTETPKNLPYIVGVYTSGTVFGGLVGRVIAVVGADHKGWSFPIELISIVGMIGIAWVACFFKTKTAKSPVSNANKLTFLQGWKSNLTNRNVVKLSLISFCMMGCFVSIYNIIVFRLKLPPFQLSGLTISLLFLTHGFGGVSSLLSGKLTTKFNSKQVVMACFCGVGIGAIFLSVDSFIVIFLGCSILTFSFFLAHSLCSGLVTTFSKTSKHQAASMYLVSYYLGASVIPIFNGYLWQAFGWSAVLISLLSVTVFSIILAWLLDEAVITH